MESERSGVVQPDLIPLSWSKIKPTGRTGVGQTPVATDPTEFLLGFDSMSDAPDRISVRTIGDALNEAWPDALAAIVCAVAWVRPDAPGFDLLSTAGLLFLIELPLVIITIFSIVRRVRDKAWTKWHKVGYVLVPTGALAVVSMAWLGPAALFAVMWLGLRTIVQLWRDTPASPQDFSGLWLKSTRIGSSVTVEWVARRPASLPPGVTMIPAGHEHVMAFVTLVTWLVVIVVIVLVPPLGVGGATAEYAAQVGWTRTSPGSEIPAHLALAAGALLFSVRTLLHFEGTGEKATEKSNIEEDAVLREVIDKVEGRHRRGKEKRKRKP